MHFFFDSSFSYNLLPERVVKETLRVKARGEDERVSNPKGWRRMEVYWNVPHSWHYVSGTCKNRLKPTFCLECY